MGETVRTPSFLGDRTLQKVAAITAFFSGTPVRAPTSQFTRQRLNLPQRGRRAGDRNPYCNECRWRSVGSRIYGRSFVDVLGALGSGIGGTDISGNEADRRSRTWLENIFQPPSSIAKSRSRLAKAIIPLAVTRRINSSGLRRFTFTRAFISSVSVVRQVWWMMSLRSDLAAHTSPINSLMAFLFSGISAIKVSLIKSMRLAVLNLSNSFAAIGG